MQLDAQVCDNKLKWTQCGQPTVFCFFMKISFDAAVIKLLQDPCLTLVSLVESEDNLD